LPYFSILTKPPEDGLVEGDALYTLFKKGALRGVFADAVQGFLAKLTVTCIF